MAKLHLMSDYRRISRLVASGAVFCAFDTETTGLSAKTDRVIEIGAVKFCVANAGSDVAVARNTPPRVTVLDCYDQLIDPGFPLPAICSRISHLNDSMVRGKPVCAAILPDFLRFAGDSILIAHNAPFDVHFINAELARAELPPLSATVMDTLRMSRALLPENGHWSLQHLAAQFGIAVHAAHRANDDARVCMELFMRLLGIILAAA